MIIKNRNIEIGDEIRVIFGSGVYNCKVLKNKLVVTSWGYVGAIIFFEDNWSYADNLPEILLDDEPIKLELK